MTATISSTVGGSAGSASPCCAAACRRDSQAASPESDAAPPRRAQTRRSKDLLGSDSRHGAALHRRRPPYRSLCETERLRDPNLPPRGDRRSSGARVARAPAETLGSRRKQKRSMSRGRAGIGSNSATARCGFTAGAARAGSLRSRPFHARGSAAHPGLAGWHAPPPRRPASRTPVRSLRRGSSGLPPPSPSP
jgi:hypothetical protein